MFTLSSLSKSTQGWASELEADDGLDDPTVNVRRYLEDNWKQNNKHFLKYKILRLTLVSLSSLTLDSAVDDSWQHWNTFLGAAG